MLQHTLLTGIAILTLILIFTSLGNESVKHSGRTKSLKISQFQRANEDPSKLAKWNQILESARNEGQDWARHPLAIGASLLALDDDEMSGTWDLELRPLKQEAGSAKIQVVAVKEHPSEQNLQALREIIELERIQSGDWIISKCDSFIEAADVSGPESPKGRSSDH